MLFKKIRVIGRFVFISSKSNIKEGSATARASSLRVRRLRRYRSRFALALVDFLETGSTREAIIVSKEKKAEGDRKQRKDLLFASETRLRLALAVAGNLGVGNGSTVALLSKTRTDSMITVFFLLI